MSKFIYASGDRPLDGYIIKRGIGQGGFGEVYYAVSEAGKEVALKLVRGNEDVELRGMQQCINLKHPNLVALYDIKVDGRGDNWVVMEYVAGEGLSSVLNRHPNGLPLDQVQSIFGDLCKAMEALHESGIVHRDLKPANVFIESGMVKVGDYGLCKFISGTQKSPQTQSIGTVHYMAPEISTGNYGKQVDIYAAGVMLFEMITGKLPFDGETVGEILMKHLTAQPDLSRLPKEYADVIGKSLAKNPMERYKSFGEFLAAFTTISGVAIPVPAPKPMPVPAALLATQHPAGNLTPQPSPTNSRSFSTIQRDKLLELCWSMVQATLFSFLAVMLWAAFDRPRGGEFRIIDFLGTLNTLVLTSWTVLIAGKLWDGKVADPWPRRTILLSCGLAIGALSGFMTPYAADSRSATSSQFDQQMIWIMVHHAFFFGIGLFSLKWWNLAARHRQSRFSLWSVIVTGIVSAILIAVMRIPNESAVDPSVFIRGLELPPVAVVLTVASVVVQLSSPWSAPPPRASRRLRWKTA
jgi:hypothetical protein